MISGQLTERNMRNDYFFFEKSYTKCDGDTIPRPFLKDKNSAYLWINILKFHTTCFYDIPRCEISEYIETKLQRTCFYLISSFFKKQRVSN